MSWSFQAIGSPAKVAEKIQGFPEENWPGRPQDYSRKEFEQVMPHLLAIVKLNFVQEGEGYAKPAVNVQASGSQSTRAIPDKPGEKEITSSSCKVSIETLYGWVG